MRRFTRAFAVGKERWRQLRRTGSFAAKHSPDKPIFSPDFGSKPTTSRTGKSTLIPRVTHGVSRNPRQAQNTASSRKQARIGFRQKEDLENKFV
jgi:hypothetical protein